MNESQRQNLLKLATFLNNKVPNAHFNLRVFVNNNNFSNRIINPDEWTRTHENLKRACETGRNQGCGAVGCAIGFCPILFPKSFKYSENHVIHRISDFRDFTAAQKFFGISQLDCYHLFVPSNDYFKKEDVVRKIRNFCRRHRHVG